MADKIYIVEGRQFKTEVDRRAALRDQELIEKLRNMMEGADLDTLLRISKNITAGKYKFETVLGDDFAEELDEAINKLQRAQRQRKRSEDEDSPSYRRIRERKSSERRSSYREEKNDPEYEKRVEAYARQILRKKEKRRKTILTIAGAVAVVSLGFLIVNVIWDNQNSISNQTLKDLRQQAIDKKYESGVTGSGTTDDYHVTINYTDDTNAIEAVVLPEFEDMLAVNANLIGWVTIDDTNIDYPVMQTTDNEYYLSHDMNQHYDRNGTIFMDTNCNVLKPSTNFILYGHHMASGKMFGNLGKYESEKYYENHKYITFDTIYEYGTYQVMYVFRSHVFSEGEVAFKYYQFYDANSEIEFNSYMDDMAAMSFYDTGVTATYGDRLLTLSTCDYQEANGRFVVVAKKIR